MLLVLRLLALTVGLGTAWRVLEGTVTNPVIRGPELAVGAALVLSAVLPRNAAGNALIAANSFALGVFSLVLSGYLVPGRPVEALLIAAMAVNLASVMLLVARNSGGH